MVVAKGLMNYLKLKDRLMLHAIKYLLYSYCISMFSYLCLCVAACSCMLCAVYVCLCVCVHALVLCAVSAVCVCCALCLCDGGGEDDIRCNQMVIVTYCGGGGEYDIRSEDLDMHLLT